MARPTRDERKAAAADSLYEACQIAEMRLKSIMEKRPERSQDKRADAVVLRVIAKAMKEYEGPEFNPDELTNKL